MKNSSAYERLKLLFDEGSLNELDAYVEGAVCSGFGCVGGVNVYAFSIDGALDLKSCKKINKTFSLAQKTGCPIIGVYNSDGLKLDGGFELINEYGELVKNASRLSGVVPQLSVIDGACLGICAVTANMSDAVIAVKNSDFYVNAPSDITVEEIAKEGVTDILCDSFEEAASYAGDIISLLPQNNLSPLPRFETEEASEGAGDDISDGIITVEFKQSYALNVKCVLTTVNGIPSGIIRFNGGAVSCESAYKAEAFIKLCDAYNIPIITVADSDSAESNKEAQLLTSLTKLVSAYSSATCPKISIITDKSAAFPYIILAGKGACADITIAWEGAFASPLSVESAVAFLWNDRLANGENRKALEKEYSETEGSVKSAAAAGAIDEIISPGQTKEKIISALDMLMSKRETTIPRKHSVK